MFDRVSHAPSSPEQRAGRRGVAHSTLASPARPRLLLLTPDFPPARGGVQLLTHRLATGMDAFETEVVTLAGIGAAEFDATCEFAVRRAPAVSSLPRARILALNAAALAEARRFRPQLTLSAHIVTSPAAAVVRRLLGAPTVQYFYAKEVGARPRLAAFAARRAHASVSISSYTARLLAEAGAPTSRIRLIPPGVDLPADPRPQPSERPTFLTISRLADRYKGHDVLVDALALIRERVPDVQWIVIGDGPLRPELEALARARGVADSVRFLGAVSDEQRDEWLSRANLLAMPSRLPGDGQAGEGFGIVYLEAGAYGKPVVAGSVGGSVDAVRDGESGLLVDPTDPRAVGEAIARLLLDPALASRLGRAGAEHARAHAWPLIADRVQALLLEQL
jgi:phosphatidylinositol alpha-1,6-mannosyltransferase